MKKLVYTIIIPVFIALHGSAQNGAAINATGTTADPSAILDVSSNSQGMLIPRMTTSERNAIVSPAEGLQIFNTTTKCFDFFAYGMWQTGNCAVPPFSCGVSSLTFTYNGSVVTYGTVTGQNGTCWLDRNLGALAAATAYNHSDSYGDFFQWGRLDDGHQAGASGTTTTLSTLDIPGHSKFILAPGAPADWRYGQNNNLWQDASGLNNPCPGGWRLPTESELNTERISWSPDNNYTGAIASPLKLPAAGARGFNDGLPLLTGTCGIYWSYTTDNTNSRRLYFSSSNAYTSSSYRAYGFSVRCIKDY